MCWWLPISKAAESAAEEARLSACARWSAAERAVFAADSAEAILGRLRILILHAGGDSRRLPAYSPCGKLFVPLPGESHSALGLTLFDRLAPSFLALPRGRRRPGGGGGRRCAD